MVFYIRGELSFISLVFRAHENTQYLFVDWLANMLMMGFYSRGWKAKDHMTKSPNSLRTCIFPLHRPNPCLWVRVYYNLLREWLPSTGALPSVPSELWVMTYLLVCHFYSHVLYCSVLPFTHIHNALKQVAHEHWALYTKAYSITNFLQLLIYRMVNFYEDNTHKLEIITRCLHW